MEYDIKILYNVHMKRRKEMNKMDEAMCDRMDISADMLDLGARAFVLHAIFNEFITLCIIYFIGCFFLLRHANNSPVAPSIYFIRKRMASFIYISI